MTTILTTSAAVILRAIHAEPFDETLRLVWRDCCEEHRNECERSEFTCVQYELEVIGDFDFTERNNELGHRCYADAERERLRARESALLSTVHYGISNRECWAGIGRCPCTVELGRKPKNCPTCSGTGRTGAMATRIRDWHGARDNRTDMMPRSFTYRRGFVAECEVTMEEVERFRLWTEYKTTLTAGIGVPLLAQLIHTCPTLEMMPVVGVRPRPDSGCGSGPLKGKRTYDWNAGERTIGHRLPKWLIQSIGILYPSSLYIGGGGGQGCEFLSEQAALDALARTVRVKVASD